MREPPPFRIHYSRAPELPVLATIPHSGTHIPLEFQTHFAPEFLKTLPNTDWHLNKLFSFLPSLGVTVLEATHSRYLIDLNRNPAGTLLGDFWTALVAESGARGETIYSSVPTGADLHSRIERFYAPYHTELKRLLEGKIAKFGNVYLLDLHSFGMPIGAQVCLGNGEGSTCSLEWMGRVHSCLLEVGLSVVQNRPFKGGYTVRHYGSSLQVEAVLLELNYEVYLEDNALDKDFMPVVSAGKFEVAQNQLERVFKTLAQML